MNSKCTPNSAVRLLGPALTSQLLTIMCALCLTATFSLHAQQWKKAELPALWIKQALVSEPMYGYVCLNKTRLFVTLGSDAITGKPGSLQLYDITSGRLIRAFGDASLIPMPRDSTIAILYSDVIHIIDAGDGTQLDSIVVAPYTIPYVLQGLKDTLALRNHNMVYVVNVATHDTIAKRYFQHTVYNVDRIPDSDSLVVAHASTSFIQGQTTFTGQVDVWSMSESGSLKTIFPDYYNTRLVGKRIVGIRLYSSSYAYYDLHSGTAIPFDMVDAYAMPSGEYVLVGKGPKLRFTVLSKDMDSLASFTVADSIPGGYFTWIIADSKVGVAVDSNVWEVDVRTLVASSRKGYPIPNMKLFAAASHTSMLVHWSSAYGLTLLDVAEQRYATPFDFDGRTIKELKPDGSDMRLAYGRDVIDLDDRGNRVQTHRWWKDTATYGYETDTWYSAPSRSEYYGRHTLDTVPTLLSMTHDGNLVDVWLADDALSYFTVDVSGRILEWDIETRELRSVKRKPVYSVKRQLAAITHSGDSLTGFLERLPSGRVTFGCLKGSRQFLRSGKDGSQFVLQLPALSSQPLFIRIDHRTTSCSHLVTHIR